MEYVLQLRKHKTHSEESTFGLHIFSCRHQKETHVNIAVLLRVVSSLLLNCSALLSSLSPMHQTEAQRQEILHKPKLLVRGTDNYL